MPKIENTYTIPVGQTTSGSIFLNEGALTGLYIAGSVVTGTTLTFLVSNDNGANFGALYTSGSTEVSLAVTSASVRSYALNPGDFRGFDVIKLRLGTSASAVAQATYPLTVVATIDNLL